ncbi:MAG: Xaa-Pro peptidase family protein [archaeon GB-1867-035]|nr:Xaa-Pro peptidase family protein [Candidatus Culexmicrobium profundum]
MITMRKPNRIRRIAQALSSVGVDVALIFSPENLCYLIGNLIDYSAALITCEGKIVTICSFLEYERAKRETWSDEVVPYSSREYSYLNFKTIRSANLLSAVCSVLIDYGFSKSVIGFEGSFVSSSLYGSLTRQLNEAIFKDVSKLFSDLRQVKDDYEVDLIRRAVKRVEYAFERSIDILSVGVSEFEVAGEALKAMVSSGGKGVFKLPIVASGVRSALPHGRASSKIIGESELVILDYVAPEEWYYGDLTRTLVTRPVSNKHEKIYSIVVEALNNAIDSIKPGVKCSEVDRAARSVIVKYGYGDYFIHSTGHGIGLSVHESPRLSSSDSTILKPGMIVTVEPGIYIPGFGGVRVERDVLVTDDGFEILDSYPVDLIVV